ncbi:MAG: D-xylose transport system permease protein [Micromonosporaceae bacterium]|nr:D-xylose transport system permease protein [Micromonosporaceae bacterium]
MADPADSTDAPTEPGAASTSVAAPDELETVDDAALTLAAPEVLADSLQEYLRAWLVRIRSGGSGALPIIAGLIALVIFFQIEQSSFLTSGNIVNLLEQAAEYILFGVAELFALLLSEIDLSVGYTAAVGAFIIAELIAAPVNLPWWVAILAMLLAMGAFGALQGTLITRLGLPSFVVTLGGLLFMNGVMLELANVDKTAVGGVIQIDPNSPVAKLVNANMSPALSWIALVVGLAAFAALSLSRASRRRSQGLSAPPIGITLLTIAATAIGGIAVVYVCNLNRGALAPLKGVPWVVPFVILVLIGVTWLLGRTRLGRYIYAIGANPEGARRAGINVARIRTAGFALCAMTAGLAGLAYESRLGSMSTSVQGGNLVLYAVAAAVIGGASLFGGRGKPLHALLGGIIIATVFNGLGLMGVSDAVQFISTAIVLILAVTLDAVVRRRAATGAT